MKKRPLRKVVSFLKKHKILIFENVFCLIVAIAFVLFFSVSTSPLYADYYSYGGMMDGGDSLQFETIGKAWTEGLIPYRDTFDHKGPVIFLVDALGFLIGGGERYGIMVFQILALFITLKFVFKFSRLATKQRNILWGSVLSIIALIFYANVYCSGNSVQEYCVPFIVASVYYIVEFLAGGKNKKHPLKYAFLYGITIGICLMSQATNAILVVAGVLAIAVSLLAQKEYKNFWQNVGLGLVGIVTVVTPFVVYFAACGAFGELIYATITYNIEYAGNIGSWLFGVTGGDFKLFVDDFWPYIVLPITMLLAWRRKQGNYVIMLAVALLLETYMFLTTEAFAQYVIPVFIQVVLFANELVILIRDANALNGTKRDAAMSFVVVGVIAIFASACYRLALDCCSERIDTYRSVRVSGVTEESIGYENVMKNYITNPNSERFLQCGSFSAYGGNALKGIYLRYGLLPNNKYFIIQSWHSRLSEKVKTDIAKNFQQKKPDCLLYESGGEDLNGINLILETDYTLVSDENGYELYVLAEK